MAVPIAKNPNGSTITGPAYEYSAGTVNLSFTPATLDKSMAKLTHRVHLNDVPEVVPTAIWNYNAAATALTLTGGFVANDIYEFTYIAKDPEIAGLGFAAVRDLNSWIKYGTAAEGNPVPNYVTRIYTEISSQPGRMLNDFRHLGFNEDESGRKVLDGLMQWISAGSGINMNYRFSQSGRTERNRQDHLYPENLFPFANVSTTDPHTGKTDSRSLCEVPGDQYLPARRRDLLGQRVLGEDGVAPAHDSGRLDRSSGFAVLAQLLHDEHAARHRQRNEPRKLPAVPESVELVPGAARAVPCVGQVVDRGDTGAR